MDPANDTFTKRLGKTIFDPKKLGLVLAAAGLSGVAAGAATNANADEDEDPSVRRKRILKNSLIAAGLGGSAAGLASFGADALSSLPLAEADMSSTDETIRSPLSRLIGGAGGVALAHNLPGSNTGRIAEGLDAQQRILHALKTPSAGGHATPFASLDEHGLANLFSGKTPVTSAGTAGVQDALKILSSKGMTDADIRRYAVHAGLEVPKQVRGKVPNALVGMFERLLGKGMGSTPVSTSTAVIRGRFLPPWARTALGLSGLAIPELLTGAGHAVDKLSEGFNGGGENAKW
jgi:hypothetical protein